MWDLVHFRVEPWPQPNPASNPRVLIDVVRHGQVESFAHYVEQAFSTRTKCTNFPSVVNREFLTRFSALCTVPLESQRGGLVMRVCFVAKSTCGSG